MRSESFSDVFIIETSSFSDNRGSFSEIYNKENILKNGIDTDFIQDNISYSKNKGTIRGLHFQAGDSAQSKLLRVLSGEIQDIFIDLRKNSSTYEKSGYEIMNPDTGWIFIPKGFAHGFCTLTDNVQVLYKVDSYYSKENEYGIKWDDKTFNVNWQINDSKPIISTKDNVLPYWNDIKKIMNF